MSSSSAHSRSGSSHSDTLLQLENIIEDHPKDTLLHSPDTLLYFADALPHSTYALPHLTDTLPYTADALQNLVDAPSSPSRENTHHTCLLKIAPQVAIFIYSIHAIEALQLVA